ncbi:hypothetical protein PQR05_31395 [Paraburkholderia sediminicola]|uniref:NHL repeat containing protein n=1 Tax=Paraburkholderia metrosideri TaxID=580937 RepID=A0ABW9DSZ8_9BURK
MRFSPALSPALLRTTRLALVSCGLIALLAGCGGDDVTAVPQRIAVSASPNGIAVRAADGALFITDDQTNGVLSSPDGHTFSHYATVPVVAGQANSLSQLSFADAGTLMIERFGFGTASAVFGITGVDAITPLSGPDPARRRLGLISIGSNRLLSTWFVKSGSTPPQGGLSLITYDPNAHTAVERDLLSGLGKPVGVAVSGDTVYVSDQANNTIVKSSLSALLGGSQAVAPSATLVQINSPDLMAVDASGTLYTKCNTTGLCRIAPDGTIRVLANDFQDARGVAVDARRHQLYAIDRAGSTSGTSYVRIFPLN